MESREAIRNGNGGLALALVKPAHIGSSSDRSCHTSTLSSEVSERG